MFHKQWKGIKLGKKQKEDIFSAPKRIRDILISLVGGNVLMLIVSFVQEYAYLSGTKNTLSVLEVV